MNATQATATKEAASFHFLKKNFLMQMSMMINAPTKATNPARDCEANKTMSNPTIRTLQAIRCQSFFAAKMIAAKIGMVRIV